MIQNISPVKVKMFDDYDEECINKMNDFMHDVDVIDVKMNTVVATTGNFFTRYLVIYSDRI